MPAFDLPLDELRVYAGRNPRPGDHDAYWDAALGELADVAPRADVVPVEHPSTAAECFDVTYDGVGHTAYLEGSACVDDAVDAYLLRGEVPEEGLECS